MKKQFKNIAVMIRGAKRVWDFTKHNIFWSYDQIAENVDYYVAVWKNTDIEYIKNDFKDKNLIDIFFISMEDINSTHYGSLEEFTPYVAAAAMADKLLEENVTKKYDSVFDQRTDCIVIINDVIITPEEEQIYVAGGIFDLGKGPELTDVGHQCTPNTYKIISEKIYYSDYNNPELGSPERLLFMYLTSKDIYIVTESTTSYLVVRPNIMSYYETPPQEITDDILTTQAKLFKEWHNDMTPEKREEFLLKHNINIYDYCHGKNGLMDLKYGITKMLNNNNIPILMPEKQDVLPTHKIVTKPWGYEKWIAYEGNIPYVMKEIYFTAGTRTSLQVHEYKIETNYVIRGEGILLISKDPFNIEKFLDEGMTSDEVAQYESKMEKLHLTEGSTFTVRPGYVHRVITTHDMTFIEVSTCEVDDVIRLQDDTGRTHGRISSEH